MTQLRNSVVGSRWKTPFESRKRVRMISKKILAHRRSRREMCCSRLSAWIPPASTIRSLTTSCGNRKARLHDNRDANLDRVSTTCDSGWVRSPYARSEVVSVRIATHPPAIAGGTDPIQARVLMLEAKNV